MSISTSESVDLSEIDSGIFLITLNAPRSRNALSRNLRTQFLEVLQALKQKAIIKLVLIEGAGKVFSAGADLKEMKILGEKNWAENREDAEDLARFFEALFYFPFPLCSIAHGAAMGGGLGLFLLSDIRYAEKSSVLAFSEVRLGLAPSVISFFLFQIYGTFPLASYMYSGKAMPLDRAVNCGFVHETFSEESKSTIIDTLVKEYREKDARALQAIKALEIRHRQNKSALSFCTEQIAQLRNSDFFKNALEKLLKKQ